MLTLIIVRHAKSSWTQSGLDDFDRPLNERGRAAAAFMGEYLALESLVPDRILCSAAQRTRETLALMLPHFSRDLDVRFMRDLYEASPTDLVDAVATFGGSKPAVMLIGHNPSIQSATTALAGDGNPILRRAVATDFPTAAVAVLRWPSRDWATIRETPGELVAFLKPRELMAQVGADD